MMRIFRLKTLDRYLMTSFVMPFIAAFFLSTFILILQTIWVYIDDIVGKGANIFVLSEMLFYLSLALFPMSLPIATLIASVMVFGGLAEQYELSSMKSAGISLARVMIPIISLTCAIALFSIVCSNFLIPVANLKFKSRLWDIRKQKPTLNLEAGVFNDDFQDIVIHIGSKTSNNQLRDVMIYDQKSLSDESLLNLTTARSGVIETSPVEKYMVMKLYDGSNYQQLNNRPTSYNYPFVRIRFQEYTKVFDLSEFDLLRTDENLFKSNRTMLNFRNLSNKIDTIYQRLNLQVDQLHEYYNRSMKVEPRVLQAEPSRAVEYVSRSAAYQAPRYPQKITKPLTEYQRLLDLFSPEVRTNLQTNAAILARNLQSQAETTQLTMKGTQVDLAKHIFEMQFRFCLAFMCIVFLFVGAPMGAIVRKGGFGLPFLVSILFFMIFIILKILLENVMEELVISPFWAAWLPSLILLPIGVFLTYHAMHDSRLSMFKEYGLRLAYFFRKWLPAWKRP